MVSKRVLAGLVSVGLLAGLLIGVLATVAGATAAAPSAQTPPATGSVTWTAGKITAVQQNGFTLQDRQQQTTTVTVGANTWIVVQKSNAAAEGALADLKVGDEVSVGGTASGSNQIAARVVQAGGARPAPPAGNGGPPPGMRGGPGGPGGAFGFGGRGPFGFTGMPATIQSISNGTLTLTLGKAGANAHTVTVKTDAGTVVIKNGLAAVGDLKVGDTVQVTPRMMARGPGMMKPAPGTGQATPPELTADVIVVTGANQQILESVVKAVNGNTLTFGGPRNANGPTVNVDAQTVYRTLGSNGVAPTAASLSDVKAGTRVLVYSAAPASGQTATASVVLILPQMAPSKNPDSNGNT